MKRLLKNLGFWIIVTMLLGVVVGAIMGPSASMFAPLGSVFIQLIKMLVVPLVAVSIISGAASLGNSRSAGLVGGVSVSFILISTMISVLLAFGAGFLFNPGSGLDKSTILSLTAANGTQPTGETPVLSFWDTLIGMIPANPIEAFAQGNILQIIVFGLFLGFGISALNPLKRGKIVSGLNSILEALVWCVEKVMWIAPLGVFGLMADAVGTFGFDILMRIFKLLWVVLLASLVMLLIIYPLLVMTLSKVSIKTFMKEMLRPQLIAFTTASSMVTLPVNMDVCENKFKVSKETAGFVLPLGATINMSGNAIYYTLVAIFFAQVYDLDLTLAHYVSIGIVATLGSIGQAGVPGPTLLVAAVLVAGGIPIDGLPLLYALDRVFDMIRTVLNITGDAACAVVTDRFVKKKN